MHCMKRKTVVLTWQASKLSLPRFSVHSSSCDGITKYWNSWSPSKMKRVFLWYLPKGAAVSPPFHLLTILGGNQILQLDDLSRWFLNTHLLLMVLALNYWWPTGKMETVLYWYLLKVAFCPPLNGKPHSVTGRSSSERLTELVEKMTYKQ